MSSFFYSTNVLSQEQLAFLGIVAVESTYTELFIEKAIWCLADLTEERGRLLTFGVPMDKRVDLLGSLGELGLKEERLIKEFKAVISRLKLANTQRNHVVHGDWTFGPYTITSLPDGSAKFAPGLPTVTKTRRSGDQVTLDAAQLNSVAEELALSRVELMAFLYNHIPVTKVLF